MKFDKLIHKKKASLAVLVDPDKFDEGLIKLLKKSSVSFILVGGSKLKRNNLRETVKAIKKITQIHFKLPSTLLSSSQNHTVKLLDLNN